MGGVAWSVQEIAAIHDAFQAHPGDGEQALMRARAAIPNRTFKQVREYARWKGLLNSGSREANLPIPDQHWHAEAPQHCPQCAAYRGRTWFPNDAGGWSCPNCGYDWYLLSRQGASR